ncbi:hypothetical protein GRJ2_001718900 [Grus japonensis]|uniref:Uncharacterized protein n=1 Tax=Grus japonensis TaxID=30415 RepID=A0ABC9X4C2_GRUJA
MDPKQKAVNLWKMKDPPVGKMSVIRDAWRMSSFRERGNLAGKSCCSRTFEKHHPRSTCLARLAQQTTFIAELIPFWRTFWLSLHGALKQLAYGCSQVDSIAIDASTRKHARNTLTAQVLFID